jgi:hypothetical protein
VDRFDLRSWLKHFDAVIQPGECGPLAMHPQTLATAPWLLRDAHELLAPNAARRALIGRRELEGRALVLVLGCGRASEIIEMQLLADELADRFADRAVVCWSAPDGVNSTRGDGTQFISPSRAVQLSVWPMLKYLPGVDLLIGAGGYNTVAEARATGTPFIGLVRERLYDRQSIRLADSERCADMPAVISAVEQRLQPRTPVSIQFENGVHAAVRFLKSLAEGARIEVSDH